MPQGGGIEFHASRNERGPADRALRLRVSGIVAVGHELASRRRDPAVNERDRHGFYRPMITPHGISPTAISLTTVRVSRSITLTLFDRPLAT